MCNSKTLKFIKEQKAKGLLINFTGIKVRSLSHLIIFQEVF